MKKLFRNTGETGRKQDLYENNSFDWDEELYEEESLEEEGYYEEEQPYEEGEGYYEEEQPYEEGEGYYEEEQPYEAGEIYYAEQKSSGSVPMGKKWASVFADFGTMDLVILGTGVAVLLVAVITGGVFLGAKTFQKQMSDFVTVGNQLDGINLIGEKGLLAVADAELARLAAANAIAEEEPVEETPGYEENEYTNCTVVNMTLTSVQKDLKVKFLNQESGKLVANVPFSITIKKPDKSTETWVDDDMDGIIYKKNLTPGNYGVTLASLTEEKYASYLVSTMEQTVEVKKDIAYKKVDVSNEVKKESEVNVSKEDTKKKETVVESTLSDTVEWIESTTVANTYIEVPKSSIPDPATLTVAKAFMRTKAQISAASQSLTVGQTGDLTASYIDDVTKRQGDFISITWYSSDTKVATVDSKGKVTAVGPGQATISYVGKVGISTVSGNGNSYLSVTGPECAVTVTGEIGTLSLDKSAALVYAGESVTLKAALKNAPEGASVTAESSDSSVATVAASGLDVTVTGVKAGSATITVTYKTGSAETKATCAVTVKVHPKEDTKTPLLDNNKQPIYVMDEEKYRPAVYADYYKADKFFLMNNVKYTGWQTIEGKVYYFNSKGVKMTGEQVIQGAKYSFDSDGVLITGSGTMGIDVSKWNGSIDWEAVKNSGVSYVIIRCGYRGSSQGALIEDPKFVTNIKGATAAGLKVGVYFFTQAVDEVEAVYEASYVLDKIKNYKISYPVFLDVEASGGRGDKIDKATRTAVCKAFCETIQNGGYTAGIYANKTWLTEKIDADALGAYKIWLAQYAAQPSYSGRYDLWQYKESGKVSGISGNVDLNLSYLGY